MSQIDSNQFIVFAVQTECIAREKSLSSLIRVNTLILALVFCMEVDWNHLVDILTSRVALVVWSIFG